MADQKPQDEAIQLIITHSGNRTKLKVKAGTLFSKVFAAYFKSKGIDAEDQKTFRFMYGEDVVNKDDSPFSLEMEEDAEITCLQAQTGGGACY